MAESGGINAVLDAIEVKKFGGELSSERITSVISGYTNGEVPDYQMAALLMAIFIKGMFREETVALTRTMADSGERYSFPECVDKHSTGGVGDKVSLTALPIVASCGAPVAKLSGRGLGITGGTIDKLEAIPGFSFDLSEQRFREQVETVGLAITEAGDLAPADKAIYALRDTTGTVDSLPLIGSSIVSKKVATGAGHLLYDVKCGSGAFMKTLEQASELAGVLVELSEALGVRASALITDMQNPLGGAIGNALEIRESVALLRGDPVPEDLRTMAVAVAVRLLELKGTSEPERAVEGALSSGAAYEKFREFVAAQGGDASFLDRPTVSGEITEVKAESSGYVESFHALEVGQAALVLGAGRERKGDPLDYGAGVEVLVRAGDEIKTGQTVARLYGSRNVERAERLVGQALRTGDEPIVAPPVILDDL
ncbi:MAG: thymidine phosphorylase [Rubrobacter sp.]